MKNLRIIFFLILILSFMSVIGCETVANKSDSPKEVANLEVASLLKFPDVPIPSGFQFIPKESYTFQSGTFRVGLLRYIGKGTMDQVVSFYKDQMPIYNWNLINIIQHETSVINLEKQIETCVITINPKGGKTADILVSIAPKPSGTASRTKKSAEEVVK